MTENPQPAPKPAHASVQFLTLQLQHTASAEEKARLWRELGWVYENELRDLPQALQALREAQKLDPENTELLNILAGVLVRGQIWEEAAQALNKRLELLEKKSPVPREECLQVLLTLAPLLQHPLKRSDDAAALYRRALQNEPGNSAAFRALEELLQGKGDWKALAEQFRQQAVQTQDVEAQIAALYRLAWVERFHLKDAAGAVKTLQAIVQKKPDHAFAIRDLTDLHRQREDWPMLADSYEQLAAALRGRAEGNLMLAQAAQMWMEKAKNRERGVLCLEQVIKENPRDVRVLQQLAEHYGEIKAWKDRKRILQMQLPLTQDPAVTRVLWRSLGEACEALGDAAGAIDAFRRILAEHPRDLSVLQTLGVHYAAQQDWPQLASLYENELKAVTDPAQALTLVLRLAVLYERHLKDFGKAVACYQKAISLWPQNTLLFWEVQRLYGLARQWPQLAESLTKELQTAADPLRRRNLLEELGDVYRDHLNDLTHAVSCFQEILKLHPTDAGAIRKLHILLHQTEAWKEIAALLGHQIAHTQDPVQAVGLYLQAAEIFDQKVKQFDSALFCYQKALELMPQHLPAIHGLGSMLYRQSDWPKLLELYKQELQVVKDQGSQSLVYFRMAQVYDNHLDDSNEAAACLVKTLQLAPDFLPATDALLSLYERSRRWPEWSALMQTWSQKVADPQQRSMALLRLARVRLQELRDSRQAQNDLLVALQIHPGNAAAQRELIDLYEGQKQWKDLQDLLQSLIAQPTTADSVEGLNLLRQRLAEIRESEFEDLKGACELWEQIVFQGGTPARSSIAQLERLYRQTANWAGLLKILNARGHQLFQSGDAKATVPLLEEMADLCAQRLNDAGRAAAYEQKILDLLPARTDIFERLRRRLQGANKTAELAELLRARLKVLAATQSSEIPDLYQDLAALYEGSLQRIPDAITCWLQVHKARPNDPLVFKSLERLYLATRDYARLGELYEASADLIKIPAEKVRVLVLAGEIFAGQLKQPDRARRSFEKAVQIDPTQLKAWEALKTLHENSQDWKALLDTHRRMLDLFKKQNRPVAEQAALLRQNAAIYEQKLQDIPSAVGVLNEALGLTPEDAGVAGDLVRLHKHTQAWEEALKVYSHWIGQIKDPPQSIVLFHERGLILENELQQADYAVLHFEKALAVNPLYLPSLARLGHLYFNRKNWDKARDVMERWVVAEQDGEQKKCALVMLGDVFKDGLNDSDKALQRYEEALSLDSSNATALDRVAGIYEQKKDWPKLVAVLEKNIAQMAQAPAAQLSPLRMKLGQVLADHLKQTDRAVAEFRSVLKAQPDHLKAQVALAELYGRQTDGGYTTQAINEYQKVLEMDIAHVETYRALAKIYEKMGQYDKVFCLYRILEVFGVASQTERSFLSENRDKSNREFSSGMSDDDRARYLLGDGLAGPLRDFLLNFGFAIDKLFKGSVEKYGFKKTDKLTVQSKNPYRDLCDKVAIGFALAEYDFYLGKDGSLKNEVVNTEPASMILSPVVLRKVSVEEQRFIYGAMLVTLKERHDLVLKAKDEELRGVMRAVRKGLQAQVTKGDPRFAGNEEAIFAEIDKAIPRKNKKALQDFSEKMKADDEKFDGAKLRQGLEWSGMRAGLLAARDIGVAVSALKKTDSQVEAIDLKELTGLQQKLQHLPYLRDLLLFAASDEYFALRKRTGLAIL